MSEPAAEAADEAAAPDPHKMLDVAVKMMAGLEDTLKRQSDLLVRTTTVRNLYLQALWALAKRSGGQLVLDMPAFASMTEEDMVTVVLNTDETRLIISAFTTTEAQRQAGMH